MVAIEVTQQDGLDAEGANEIGQGDRGAGAGAGDGEDLQTATWSVIRGA